MSKTIVTARDQAIREQVAVASRVLGNEDLGDFVLGHVSVRDPDGRGIWMKATGWGFEEISPDRVQLLGWEGQILAGEGRRHVEYPIHTEIIRARRDVNSVVHAHAPHAVAFASLQVPLRPISHEGGLFVPPDIARFTKTGDLILTRELGEALAQTLGGRNAALMVHHGIATAGETVEAAVVARNLLLNTRGTHTLCLAVRSLWPSPRAC